MKTTTVELDAPSSLVMLMQCKNHNPLDGKKRGETAKITCKCKGTGQFYHRLTIKEALEYAKYCALEGQWWKGNIVKPL